LGAVTNVQAKSETIYMPLLDEGTDVWAPVQAERLSSGRYRVLGPMPDHETWQFEPGCIVLVEERRFTSGTRGLAAAAISN